MANERVSGGARIDFRVFHKLRDFSYLRNFRERTKRDCKSLCYESLALLRTNEPKRYAMYCYVTSRRVNTFFTKIIAVALIFLTNDCNISICAHTMHFRFL